MKLEQAANIVSIELKRDAEFTSLGFVTHQTLNRLIFLENEKYLPKLLAATGVSAVISTAELADQIPSNYGLAISSEPRKAFYLLHNHLAANTNFYWTSFPSRISNKAVIHPTAYIAPTDVVIEDGVIVEPKAVILERSIIGEDSIIRSGVTVSVESFEFKRFGTDVVHILQAGGTRLGKRVEVQCNSNIDRSLFGGFTEIGDDTKLGATVHIGVSSVIGKRCLFSAHTVISGSTTIEDEVWIGPGCAVSSELHIGKGAYVTIGAVVTRDVNPGQHVSGNFAIDHDKYLAFIKSIR